MPRSLYRSSTSLLTLLALAACGEDSPPVECGIGDAPMSGMIVTSDEAEFEYGGFRAGANNDCRIADAPDDVVSVTIFGQQVFPAGAAVLSLCLPRPDEIDVGRDY